MYKTVICVPHHLPTLDFLNDWQEEIKKNGIYVMIVEDKPKRETTTPNWLTDYWIYTHENIDADLGKNSWIIPRKSSAIRSYGFWKAWQMGFDYIYTIDNDTAPDSKNFFQTHRQNLDSKVTLDWQQSWADIPPSRGFPYNIRNKSEVVLSHGLWSNVPDMDAPSQLVSPLTIHNKGQVETQVIARHNYFPMCGMNLAFKRKIAPLMYFGLQGPEWPFDRMDDIWAGIIAKKVIDHLGLAVVSGEPFVEHRKQSNVYDNLIKEAPGIKVNEYFWQNVDGIELYGDNLLYCYQQIAEKLNMDDKYTEYWRQLRVAMQIWADLFV